MSQQKSLKLYDAAIGWIKALQKLEEETNAPLIETTKLLDDNLASDFLKMSDYKNIDTSYQYNILLDMWYVLKD